MLFIRHRVNSPDEWVRLAPGLGAEVDLRSRGDVIVLNHEAFEDGPSFESFLATWASGPRRGPLILNPKEDGLEKRAAAMCAAHGIDDWFFLDLSLPTMVRLSVKEGCRNVAVRVSEYESVEAAMRFAGLADWAWVDSFCGEPPDLVTLRVLAARFRVCLVSPELEGHPLGRIDDWRHLANEVHAVCTKRPEAWGWIEE